MGLVFAVIGFVKEIAEHMMQFLFSSMPWNYDLGVPITFWPLGWGTFAGESAFV